MPWMTRVNSSQQTRILFFRVQSSPSKSGQQMTAAVVFPLPLKRGMANTHPASQTHQADPELGVTLGQLHLRTLCYKEMPCSSIPRPGVLGRWLSMKNSNEKTASTKSLHYVLILFYVLKLVFSLTFFPLFFPFSPVANEHLRIWFSSLEWLPLTARMLICLNPFSSSYLEVNHLEPAF